MRSGVSIAPPSMILYEKKIIKFFDLYEKKKNCQKKTIDVKQNNS